MRYLEIKFHDNDFNMSFEDVLVDFYNHFEGKGESISTMPVKRIEEIIRKSMAVYAMRRQVLEDWYPEQVDEEIIGTFVHYMRYFKKITVEFHETKDFSNEWQNGGHWAMHLHTGAVWNF